MVSLERLNLSEPLVTYEPVVQVNEVEQTVLLVYAYAIFEFVLAFREIVQCPLAIVPEPVLRIFVFILQVEPVKVACDVIDPNRKDNSVITSLNQIVFAIFLNTEKVYAIIIE